MSMPLHCSSESYRLNHGPKQEEPIPGIGTVVFSVICDGNAEEVLNTSKSVMRAICSQSESKWPNDTTWRTLLPQRFVSACADEMTPEEVEQWLKNWQRLNQEQREAEERNRNWSLANWLYWLQPSERLWQWWDAEAIDPSCIIVCFAVKSWPFGSGAISWLFRGSGAKEVVAVNQRTS